MAGLELVGLVPGFGGAMGPRAAIRRFHAHHWLGSDRLAALFYVKGIV
jgi:hypothetical protein